jgi:DNA-binding transcriptional ArsR family regulator
MRRHRSLRFALASGALIALLLTASAAAAEQSPPPRDTALFHYDNGARTGGQIGGHCQARAVAATGPGSWIVAGAAFTLRHVDVWVNQTTILGETGVPITVILDRASRVRSEPLDPGTVGILRGDAGRVVAYPAGGLNAPVPFPLQVAGAALESGAAASRHMPHPGWDLQSGRPLPLLEGPAFWTRHVTLRQGTMEFNADVSLYLQHVVLTQSGRTIALAPYRERTATELPGVNLLAEHFRYAWLDVTGGHLLADARGHEIHCTSLDLDVRGLVVAYGARGTASRAGQTISFARNELVLVGEFRLLDAPDTAQAGYELRAPVAARAEGRFDAVGVDFRLAGGSLTDLSTAQVIAAGAILLLLLGGGIFFYTRIAEDAVLDQPERRALMEAVRSDPGLDFRSLQRRTQMSPTNARYHLRFLQQRGLLRVVRVQGRHHYVPSGQDLTSRRRALLVASDPKIQALLSALDHQAEASASTVVQNLRRAWGLSRTGSWKVIERAVRAQLVERRVVDGRVLLRTLDT